MKKIKFIAFAFATIALDDMYSISIEEHYGPKSSLEPFFTGPIIAPSGHVVPVGNVNVQPYIFYTSIPGFYDKNWNFQSQQKYSSYITQIPIQTGIYKNIGISITPQMAVNKCGNKRYFGFGDLPFKINYQIRSSQINSWLPAVKFSTGINFPVGSYDGLDPNNLATDYFGTGSWLPNLGVVLASIKQLGNTIHFFSYRLACSYTFGTPTNVSGSNVYGGGKGTYGTVFPGNILQTSASFETNFTRRFAFAMDIVYNHFDKTRFTGKTVVPNTRPSAELFSIAPALEYNWNENIGIIGGTWLSVMGRNTASFTSAVIAINIYN